MTKARLKKTHPRAGTAGGGSPGQTYCPFGLSAAHVFLLSPRLGSKQFRKTIGPKYRKYFGIYVLDLLVRAIRDLVEARSVPDECWTLHSQPGKHIAP